MAIEQIKICSNHTKRVPLLWTFKFMGADYWCPYCGFTGGMFGSGENVNCTEKLLSEKQKWKDLSKSYLSGETEEWEYEHKH